MTDVECPYCGEDVEINHDDGYGYEEGMVYTQECSHCDKTFTYTTGVIYVYRADKAPCQNGEPHSWKDVHGFPKGYQSNRRQCEWCEEIGLKNEDLVYNVNTDTWNEKVKA